jgi:hypothetical protein
VVGEIGRDRLEYQYDMSYCDIVLIIRGYRRRNVLQYQLQRLQAFASTFAFSGNEKGLKPEDLWPLYFDRYKEQSAPPISQDEVKELQDEMAAINAQAAAESQE